MCQLVRLLLSFKFLVSYFSYLITLSIAPHIVNMDRRSSPFSLFFFSPHNTKPPSRSLFPSHPSFHSSFSSHFHLRRFTLNVLNVDKWGFPAPPLEHNLKNEESIALYVCICVTGCLFTCLCEACLVCFNRVPVSLGKFWYTLTPWSIIVLFTMRGYLA